MQDDTPTLLILLWGAFPVGYSLAVLIWAMRQREGGRHD